MTIKNTGSLLRQVPLLSDLPEAELQDLASTLKVVALDQDGILFREGEPGESLYILIDGTLEVLMGMDTPDQTRLATLGPGESIGEMSLLLPGGVRTASVRAKTHAHLWMMTRADFDVLLVHNPRMAYALVRMLTRRLEGSNIASFHDLQEKNRRLQQAYDELKAAQAQLIEKERLERELQVAAIIQESILPHELPSFAGVDFGALMIPARMVGGDFYDVFPLDEHHIVLVVGDVADKGIPSAIFMARTHALIASEANHGGTPDGIIRRVNAHLIRLEQSNLFVTILFGILDSRDGKFIYARAGHESPILLMDRKAETLPRGTGQPVGLLDDPLLDERSISLQPGSTLLLFTDGVTDGYNVGGEHFGHQRVISAMETMAGKPAQAACDFILASLRQFQTTAPQFDDITLLAVHLSGS